jgi:hypothetical protein
VQAGLPKMGHTNFYEKALFVKTDVAVALCGRVQQSCVLFARAIASIRCEYAIDGCGRRLRSA